MFDLYLVYALTGALGGLLVGLLGTGNGLIIMPTLVLVFSYTLEGFDVLRLAAGTTVATMAVGAIAGALAQWRAGNIDWQLLKLASLPYMFGALLGPWLARFLPGQWLKAYLAGVMIVIALRMLFAHRRQAQRSAYRDHKLQIVLVLLSTSTASSLAGLPSGVFAIPYLGRFALALKTIIGTSTASAALYGAFGTLGYVSAGWCSPALPPGALGFVYLPALLTLAVVVSVAAPLGVRLARYVDEPALRKAFALFLLLAALAILVV